jgi:hypothetical protein
MRKLLTLALVLHFFRSSPALAQTTDIDTAEIDTSPIEQSDDNPGSCFGGTPGSYCNGQVITDVAGCQGLGNKTKCQDCCDAVLDRRALPVQNSVCKANCLSDGIAR